jgi:60 kDa SS-A/Ro ribonucleoprotein
MANSPYEFTNTRNKPTPADMPIKGRESEMKENLAGGVNFKASDVQALRRWLLTGSMFDAYYQGKEEMTDANVRLLEKVVDENPELVANEILYASQKGISVHTPIFALTYLSMGDKSAKEFFRAVFPEVIRTASHLYEFLNYTKGTRGFGSIIHKTIKDWFASKDASELEYQFLKYQSRYGWAGRDVLRMIKPVPEDNEEKAVFNWIVGGTKKNPLLTEWPKALERINAYEKLKSGNVSESDVIEAINKYRMTWEMMPGNLERTGKIWEALFHNMPVGATIRNLGNLTDKGVFENTANIDILEERLSEENLKRAYIHPVGFAKALKVYSSSGNIGKSKLTWRPVPRIMDIMEDGIERCFDVIEPTGLNFFYALDVSGSMTCTLDDLTPLEIQGILALASARTEKNYFIGGFSDNFIQLSNFTSKRSYADVSNFRSDIWPDDFGGTNASSAYSYAIRNQVRSDVFVFITDSENWGCMQPSSTLKAYRNKINKDAKAIYITIVPYGDHITLADPKDKNSYDIAGFTADTPKLINMIAKGEL